MGKEKPGTRGIRAVPNSSSQGKPQTLLHRASCLPPFRAASGGSLSSEQSPVLTTQFPRPSHSSDLVPPWTELDTAPGIRAKLFPHTEPQRDGSASLLEKMSPRDSCLPPAPAPRFLFSCSKSPGSLRPPSALPVLSLRASQLLLAPHSSPAPRGPFTDPPQQPH